MSIFIIISVRFSNGFLLTIRGTLRTNYIGAGYRRYCAGNYNSDTGIFCRLILIVFYYEQFLEEKKMISYSIRCHN